MSFRAFLLAIGVAVLGIVPALAARSLSLATLPPAVQQAIRSFATGSEIVHIEESTDPAEPGYNVDIKKGGAGRTFTVSPQGKLLSVEMALAEVPAAIQKIIKEQAGSRKIGTVERVTRGEDTVYEADVIHGRQHRSLSVAGDGSWFTMEIDLKDAPGAVQKTVRATIGKAKIVEVTRSTEDGEVSYEVDFVKNGSDRSLAVDADGALLEIEVDLSETPVSVQKTITDMARGGKIGDIMKVFDEGTEDFEVTITAGGIQREYTIDSAGKVVRAQVGWSEVPAPVRKTANEKLAGAKLSRLDKAIAADGAVTYEVEAKRGGRDYTVIIAADGSVVDEDK